MSPTLTDLKNLGFRRTGKWEMERGCPVLRDEFPHEAGIYLFIAKKDIKYIGVANNLAKRLSQYSKSFQRRYPEVGPRAVDKGIKSTLDDKLDLAVYTYSFTKPRFPSRGGLPFDDLVGLEAGLIEKIRPAWNKGKAPPLIVDSSPA